MFQLQNWSAPGVSLNWSPQAQTIGSQQNWQQPVRPTTGMPPETKPRELFGPYDPKGALPQISRGTPFDVAMDQFATGLGMLAHQKGAPGSPIDWKQAAGLRDLVGMGDVTGKNKAAKKQNVGILSSLLGMGNQPMKKKKRKK